MKKITITTLPILALITQSALAGQPLIAQITSTDPIVPQVKTLVLRPSTKQYEILTREILWQLQQEHVQQAQHVFNYLKTHESNPNQPSAEQLNTIASNLMPTISSWEILRKKICQRLPEERATKETEEKRTLKAAEGKAALEAIEKARHEEQIKQEEALEAMLKAHFTEQATREEEWETIKAYETSAKAKQESIEANKGVQKSIREQQKAEALEQVQKILNQQKESIEKRTECLANNTTYDDDEEEYHEPTYREDVDSDSDSDEEDACNKESALVVPVLDNVSTKSNSVHRSSRRSEEFS